MRIALAQYPITRCQTWADWRIHTEAWVAKGAQGNAQLLVFPEYGAMEVGALFPEDTQAYLDVQLEVLQHHLEALQTCYAELSKQYGVVIVAPSLPIGEVDRYVNRTWVFSPTRGLVGWQDKWHMTRFELEEWSVRSPEKFDLTIFEADWGTFGIQLCYDVEFPLGSALLARSGACMIVAPSCTDSSRGANRVHIGARARALENQCYVAVAQTVGDAVWSPAVDVNYGYAAVYGPPDGSFPDNGILAAETPQKEGWLFADVDMNALALVRTQGQVLNFRDHFDTNYTCAKAPVRVRTLML